MMRRAPPRMSSSVRAIEALPALPSCASSPSRLVVRNASGCRISWPTLAARSPSAASLSVLTSFPSSCFAAVMSRAMSVTLRCPPPRGSKGRIAHAKVRRPARTSSVCSKSLGAPASTASRTIAWIRAPLAAVTTSRSLPPHDRSRISRVHRGAERQPRLCAAAVLPRSRQGGVHCPAPTIETQW